MTPKSTSPTHCPDFARREDPYPAVTYRRDAFIPAAAKRDGWGYPLYCFSGLFCTFPTDGTFVVLRDETADGGESGAPTINITRMKKLLLLSLLLLGCKRSNDVTSTLPVTVYSWEAYERAKAKGQPVIVVDTLCPSETKRAKADIARNRLVYFSPMYSGAVVDEMNRILTPYHMIAKASTGSCLSPPGGFDYGCYERVMYAEVKKRYGQKWIDSIERTAIKNYVLRHPDEPFYENGKDLREVLLVGSSQ